MRIIITGGSGLIGSALADRLADHGNEVIVLTRSPEKVQPRLRPGIRAVAWDGRSSAGWLEVAEGADAIVNLAGENISGGRWTDRRKQRILQSRINAGKAVTEAIERTQVKPRVLVQSSAVGFYGPQQDEVLTEAAAPGRDFLAQVTQQWEDSTAAVEAMGVRRVTIRTGVVLSKAGGALPLMALPFRLFAGGPVGSGKQWLPWIHLEDEIEAIRFLIENDQCQGVFNLTAPTPLTNRDFSKVLGRVLRRPAFLPAPGLALKLVLGEMATIVLDGQRALPDRLESLGYQFKYSHAEAALQEIYQPGSRRYQHSFRVQASHKQVVAFHHQAQSLAAITPPFVGMKLHSAPPHGLASGDELDFTLQFGPLPVRWRARVEEVSGQGFTDRQLSGPFKRWQHRHAFIPLADDVTEVQDTIEAEFKPHLLEALVGLGMWLGLPALFWYRGWKTRRLLQPVKAGVK